MSEDRLLARGAPLRPSSVAEQLALALVASPMLKGPKNSTRPGSGLYAEGRGGPEGQRMARRDQQRPRSCGLAVAHRERSGTDQDHVAPVQAGDGTGGLGSLGAGYLARLAPGVVLCNQGGRRR